MRQFYVLLIFISFNFFMSAQSAEVGSTPGELSVSLSGAANYIVPIAVPPGINGIVPQINIVYNSQAGSGTAGYGWNIGGISTISRIASTKFHDDVIDPVDFDSLDRFAFDGKRLIVKNGTGGVYGANETIYETESFSNVKITSYGVHPSGSNYGPAYFVVRYPDGSKAYYGNSTDSCSITDWAITYWENAQGVRISYSYSITNNILNVTSIKYGTLSNVAPINEIKFNYDSTSGDEQGYVGGQSLVKTKKLASISTVGNGVGFRNYFFDYIATSEGYDLLYKITEKSGDLSKSYNPTVFEYDPSSEVILPKPSTSTIPLGNVSAQNSAIVSGDFDGDARMDFVLYPTTGANAKKEFRLFSNIGGNSSLAPLKQSLGYFESIFPSTGLTSNGKMFHYQGITVAQFDTDLDAVNFTTYYNSSYGLAPEQVKKAVFPNRDIQSCDNYYSQGQKKFFFNGDFNGDGLTDVVALDMDMDEYYCQEDPYTGEVRYIWSKNSTGGIYFVDLDRRKTTNFVNYAGALQDYYLTGSSRIETFDVNGDGKTDILHFQNGKVSVYSLNNNNQLELLWQKTDTDIKINQSILPGDYNGDGKMDFIITKSFGLYSSDYIKYISMGNDFEKIPQTYAFNNMGNTEDSQAIYTCTLIPLDTNADGKTDIVQLRSVYAKTQGAGAAIINVFKNINSTFAASAVPTFQTPYSNTVKSYPIPVFLSPQTNNQYTSVGLISDSQIYAFDSQDNFSRKGLIKSITDGNQVKRTITYSPLQQDQYEPFYTPHIFIENFPNIDIVAAPNFKVVTKLEEQSVGQYKKQIFTYAGAVSNAEGLGFLGFRSTMRSNWYEDESKMISNISKFDILQRGANIENYQVLGFHYPLFPATNQIPRIITKEQNYVVNDSDNLVATQRIILKPKTIIQSGSTFSAKIVAEENNSTNVPNNYITKSTLTFESDLLPNKVFKIQNTVVNQFNNLEGTSTETINAYDDYNNVTGSKILYKEGSSVVKTAKFDVVYQAPIQAPYIVGRPSSKTQSVSVNGDSMSSKEIYSYNGNQLLETIEKSGQGTSTIKEKNDYDSFGNIVRKTISPPSLPARVTNYEYDSSGRFLIKSTDIEGLTKTFVYNSSSGVLDNETNQNGLKTSYLYDSWFKKEHTTDYLGKSNHYVYSRSAEKTIVTNTGDDNSSIEETFDDLGRKVKVRIKDVTGNFSSVDYSYDIEGRNYKVSEPYFTGSPSQFSETKYDVYGRVENTISFTGKKVDYTYSGLTTTVSENSKTKISVKNAAGNVISMTDSPGGTVTYTYFANGNLKESDYGGVKTTITQDGWGRKIKLVDSSAGIYSYEYNDFGEITKETTPNGVTTYTLDDYGKVKEKTISGNLTNSKTTYLYDSSSKLLLKSEFQDFANGGSITNEYFYDSYKRINRTVEATQYALFTKDFEYDAFGRASSTTFTAQAAGKGSTRKVKNTYSNGAHWQILDDATSAVLWQTNTLDARGKLLTAVCGPVSIVNSYDIYGFAKEFNYNLAANTAINILKLGADFDPVKANLKSRSNSLFNRSETFKYDALDRLTEFTNLQGNQETQSYDDRGRILQNSVGLYNYTNTNKPYQNTSVDVTADALAYYSGRQTLDVTYNVFKSPVEIVEAGIDRISFNYNDSNSRSAMFYGGLQENKFSRNYAKYYSADGSMEIKHNLTNGAVDIITYIGGDGYTAPIILKSNGISQNYLYLLRDYLGSIVAITDQSGAVVEKRLFDAWGNIVSVQDGVGNSLAGLTILDRGYTGHEHLQSVGIVHMNGRLYDPKLHRFMQPDNYVQDPFNTQNFNRYGYCWNNPLVYTDQSGEFVWFVPLIYAAINVGVDLVKNNGKMNIGQISMSAGMGAISGLTSGATTVGGAFLGAGIGQLNKFMPSMTLYESSGFNLGISPMIGFGTSGFNVGASLNADAKIGDVALGASFGFGYNSGTSSLGESSGGSGFYNYGGYLAYNDGHANYGLGYSFNTFGGKTGQGVAAISILAGDFTLRIDEDYLGDKGDRYRTGGMLATYKVNNDLTLAFGGSMMTGDAFGEDAIGGNPYVLDGRGMHKNEIMPQLRAGTMYGGVIYKGHASFYGHNNEKRLHSIQNWIHRQKSFITPYFPDRGLSSKAYNYSGSYNSNYLFY
ncbi:FG-GAP-like repeat-containing protein [Flavobacterium sharifuzzamanii]|uniref:FG-GAP-like repeat-containing protein n=1 Tax=Flavobacterium sharifuzzamanii TaxID=2211133 RepID=UPI000DADD5B1|nr:FG-GAP-like repeat-containing protein [Flavobacterium sharifuzzamanii]KAF2080632.1 hypothetical protein DMA14_10655 [Flavobacterium sharifuzzamanii]